MTTHHHDLAEATTEDPIVRTERFPGPVRTAIPGGAL